MALQQSSLTSSIWSHVRVSILVNNDRSMLRFSCDCSVYLWQKCDEVITPGWALWAAVSPLPLCTQSCRLHSVSGSFKSQGIFWTVLCPPSEQTLYIWTGMNQAIIKYPVSGTINNQRLTGRFSPEKQEEFGGVVGTWYFQKCGLLGHYCRDMQCCLVFSFDDSRFRGWWMTGKTK